MLRKFLAAVGLALTGCLPAHAQVTSLGGATGAITAGAGLTVSGSSLITTYQPAWTGAGASTQPAINDNIVYGSEFLGSKTCDGVTDVSTELQAFLTAVATNGVNGKSTTGIFPPGECYVDSSSSLTFTVQSSGTPSTGNAVHYHLLGYGTSIKTGLTRVVSGLVITHGTFSTYGDEQTGVTVEGLTIKHRNNPSAVAGFNVSMSNTRLVRNQVFAGDENGTHNYANYNAIYLHQLDSTNPNTGPQNVRLEQNIIKGTRPGGELPIAILVEGAANALVIRANVVAEVTYGVLVGNPCASASDACGYLANGVVVTENSFDTAAAGIRFVTSVPAYSTIYGWQIIGNRMENISGAVVDTGSVTQQSAVPLLLGPNTLIGSATYLYNTNNIVVDVRDQFVGQATIDPASLAAGATTTVGSVTVRGAATNMPCTASVAGDTAGIIATCYVSAADTVTFRNTNATAGAINLGSMLYLARVHRRSSLKPPASHPEGRSHALPASSSSRRNGGFF